MTAAPIIEVGDLVKTYRVRPSLLRRTRELRAVSGVSFGVAEGTTFGLVGESGSGKTTTAKLIMGAEQPTSGQIRIGGRALQGRHNPWLRHLLQPVLQDPYSSLSPRMRIGRIVDEPLRIHRRLDGHPALEKRVAELLADVGLPSDYARRHPRALSGGQRQRVAIARALALEPRVLVLDEPVSALDVSIQAQVLNMLADLQAARRMTYLLISHDLAVVACMSTHIGVLYLGGMMELGRKEALIERPRHPYTRALIDAAEPRRGAAIAPLEGEIPSPLDPPAGCPFHPRCPVATALCRSARPALREVAKGQYAACHLA